MPPVRLAPVVARGRPTGLRLDIDGSPWRVRILRPPTLALIHDITAPIDPEAARTFDEQGEVIGNGLDRWQFTVYTDDAFGIEPKDIVQFVDQGTVIAAGVVRSSRTVRATVAGRGRYVTTIFGVGLHGLLEQALIYPSQGTGSVPVEEDRVFNWTSPDMDISSWAPVVEICTVAEARGGEWPSQPMGVGWPSDGSQSFMIGPTGATSTDAPVGWIYTVGDTTLAEDGRYLLAVIIDNEGTAYGDSVPLINVNQNDGFRRVSQITLDLSAGDHRFAISARNAEPTSGPNPIAIAMELWKADQAGFPTELVFQTDDTWRGVFYPDRPPGMTPGQAALICLAEAQDRDALTWLVPSFTAEVDSDGRAWPEYGDLACKAGRTPIWKFIEQLIGSGYVDSRIALNGRRWDLYVADGLGEPSGVAYTTDPDPEVGNLHAWVEVTTAPRAEAILAKSRFGWSERGTATSGNRVEGVLGLGALQSPAEVDRWTDAQLALYSQARIQHDIEVTPVGPADTPLIAYRPRDLITVDGDEHRVVSVAWARDRNGRVTYTPRIGARLDEEDERLRRAVESMVAGTFSGDSKIATPLDQVAYQSQANPDPPAGSICFRADGFGTVEATDVVHAFTDDNIGLLVHTGGFTIDANGLIVPPPSPAAMAWDLTAIVNGTAAGSSYLQYMSIRLRTYNAAGSSYDSSHEVRLEWQDLPGGPTAWGSVPMCTLIVPAGGKIGITVANFNTGDADVEFEIGGHSIAPADYEVPG